MGNTFATSKRTAPLVPPSLEGERDRVKELVGAFLASFTLTSPGDDAFPDSKLAEFVNRQDSSGNAALHAAVFRDHREIVEFLLYCGASLELSNGLGCSPIWLAAGYGHLDLLSYLLDHMRDDDQRRRALLNANSSGDTPLLAAASRGHEDVCAKLLNSAEKLGVEQQLKSQLNLNCDSPLSASLLAIEEPPSSLVDLLVDGSIINSTNSAGSTPLLLACERNWPDLLQRLLRDGASAEGVRDGRIDGSPLAVAAFCGSADTLQVLLRSHPSLLDQQTNAGCSPLWLSTRAGHTSCSKMLLDAGANPHLADRNGLTPYDVAVKYETQDHIALLTS